MLQIRVEKCPGGVAVVIPEPLATQAGLQDGGLADLEVSGGQLVVRSGAAKSLADLLAGVTPDNLHGEWAAGPPAGAELL